MAGTLEEINERTLGFIADKARERLAAGSDDLLDTLLVAYQAATPVQRQTFEDIAFGDSVTTGRGLFASA